MRCVTIQYQCVASLDLAWMVKDNHPSHEDSCFHRRITFAVPPDKSPWQISLPDTFLTLKHTLSPGRASLKASWGISTDLTSGDWSKGDYHARVENTSHFHSACRANTNTPNFVDVLEGQRQGLVTWTSWQQDAIPSPRQRGSTGPAIFTGDFTGMLAFCSSLLSLSQRKLAQLLLCWCWARFS